MMNATIELMSEINSKNNDLIENFHKNIIDETFHKIINLINSHLSSPIKGFLIRGHTPYFNDGEECTHSSDFALHSLSLDKNFTYNLLENSEMFELLFEDYDFYKNVYAIGGIYDSWDYHEKIKSGVVEPILPCSTLEELELIEHGVSVIEKLIEKIMITNYIAIAKLQDEGTYTFTYKHFEPDY